VLKYIILIIFISTLRCEVHIEVIEQAQKWHNIQQQLVALYSQYHKISDNRLRDNQEFFNIQQQLGAIYFAQKRYQLGFGTALLPSTKAVHNYVRKKTFLTLKTKELMPLYKQYVLEYQKKYASGEFDRVQKFIKQLEALNVLHIKLFEQLEQEHGNRHWVDISKIDDISSIESCIKKLPVDSIGKKSNHLLNWITPVAGIQESSSKMLWKPLAGALVLSPDVGIVTSIGRLNGAIVVFIKQHHFTYVITGLNRCCVSIGDKLKQGEPLGFCASTDPCLIELQLWRDDIALDPDPYHKVIQL
jgi:hypothetical protein